MCVVLYFNITHISHVHACETKRAYIYFISKNLLWNSKERSAVKKINFPIFQGSIIVIFYGFFFLCFFYSLAASNSPSLRLKEHLYITWTFLSLFSRFFFVVQKDIFYQYMDRHKNSVCYKKWMKRKMKKKKRHKANVRGRKKYKIKKFLKETSFTSQRVLYRRTNTTARLIIIIQKIQTWKRRKKVIYFSKMLS